MSAIKKDLVNGRDLKVGSIYIPNGETCTFCKITGVTTSKPGKHGSAKNIITARNIINGKNISATFKDTDEKIMQVLDFNYVYRVVYSISESEICVDLESGEMIHIASFGTDGARLENALNEERGRAGKNLANEKGHPLVIKYSEVDETGTALIFWELLYVPVEDLPRHGIANYTAPSQ